MWWFFFYHLPDQSNELLDLVTHGSILLAPSKRAILIVEPNICVKMYPQKSYLICCVLLQITYQSSGQSVVWMKTTLRPFFCSGIEFSVLATCPPGLPGAWLYGTCFSRVLPSKLIYGLNCFFLKKNVNLKSVKIFEVRLHPNSYFKHTDLQVLYRNIQYKTLHEMSL